MLRSEIHNLKIITSKIYMWPELARKYTTQNAKNYNKKKHCKLTKIGLWPRRQWVKFQKATSIQIRSNIYGRGFRPKRSIAKSKCSKIYLKASNQILPRH